MQIKSLFDRLDVLGEDVKQKYINNLTECNDPRAIALGYSEWMLHDITEKRGFITGCVYAKSSEGHEFWTEQQIKFNLLNSERYDD